MSQACKGGVRQVHVQAVCESSACGGVEKGRWQLQQCEVRVCGVQWCAWWCGSGRSVQQPQSGEHDVRPEEGREGSQEKVAEVAGSRGTRVSVGGR